MKRKCLHESGRILFAWLGRPKEIFQMLLLGLLGISPGHLLPYQTQTTFHVGGEKYKLVFCV